MTLRRTWTGSSRVQHAARSSAAGHRPVACRWHPCTNIPVLGPAVAPATSTTSTRKTPTTPTPLLIPFLQFSREVQKPPQGDAQIHRCAPRSGAESLLKNPPTSSLHTPTATAHACASSQPSAAGPSQDQSRKKAQNPRSTTASHRSHDQDAAAAYAGCARPACVDGVRSARRRRNGCAPPPAREPESSRHGSRLRGVGERRL